MGGQSLNMQMRVFARKLARAQGSMGAVAFGAGLDATINDSAADFGAVGDFPAFGLQMPAAPVPDPQVRVWRVALARAARDHLKMTVGFSDVTLRNASLTEVLETPMQRALILMLQGRGETMGLMVLSGHMLAALIEMLTLTRLSHAAPSADDLRKPTRTDAAMAVEFIDAALAKFEAGMAEAGLGNWAQGYRYAAFIDDPRPLHLMLEDVDYHVITSDLALEDGARGGTMILALPTQAEVQVQSEFSPIDFTAPSVPDLDQVDHFTADLAQSVQDLSVQIGASLAHISLPLERVLRLQVGEVLILPMASLDMIDLRCLDGRRVAGARLGQNRGMRALRLTDVPSHRLADGGNAYDTPASAQAAQMGLSLTSADGPFLGADAMSGYNIDPFPDAMHPVSAA